MKRVIYSIGIILSGCAIPNTAPNIGDRHEIQKPGLSVMSASAQTYPYEDVYFSGIKYGVGVNNSGRIAYLCTSDPNFKTPEGISVQSTLEEVLKAGAAPPWYEPGWAHHTKLPSGWSVAFTPFSSQDGRIVEIKNLRAGSKVAWIFKRS
jgi:hypothetical protein